MMSIAKVSAVSVLCTLAAVAIFFCLLYQRFATFRWRWTGKVEGSFRREEAETHEESQKLERNVKALIVEEHGVDVLYLRKLEDGRLETGFPKVLLNPSYGEDCSEEEKRMDGSMGRMKRTASQEALLLQEPAGAAFVKEKPVPSNGIPFSEQPGPSPWPPALPEMASVIIPAKQIPSPVLATGILTSKQPHPPPPPLPPTPTTIASLMIPAKQTPPPALPITLPLPPPPPPPPPPPIRALIKERRIGCSPAGSLLPPPEAGISARQLKSPPASQGGSNRSKSCDPMPMEQTSKGDSTGPRKLKPLHWDKITATNAEHSVVWDDINNGSLRFDERLMETLFGYTNNVTRRSPGNGRNTVPTTSDKPTFAFTSQTYILEPIKSQNTAIILRSLAASRRDILEALLEGQGLSADNLEKLTRIAPTQEQASRILQFEGDLHELSDAESFLYHILKAVPSAFTRFNAMLFKLNYDADVLHLKESLQTLELACRELRTRGPFLKLLEAVLKAGNRMNAGTARGNALGFKLSALDKLYDVKSTDGKTTLLHFIVEQVIRSEGRRLSSSRTPTQLDFGSVTENEEEKEFLSLGLLELGSLRTEFSNVRKAATVEYESFINMCSSLSSCAAEIRNLVSSCDEGERGQFLREMKQFLEGCDGELKAVGEEQARVMELVKRTMEYYQVGASKDNERNPLQLFIIIKNFLDMVGRVTADITQKLTKKNPTSNMGSSPPLSPPTRSPPRFENARLQMLKNTLPRETYSSESEDDFT